jgi:hypothetical protein
MNFTAPSLSRTLRYLRDLKRIEFESLLQKYGERGVRELSAATPVDTGLTKDSWSYEVVLDGPVYRLVWKNSVMAGATPLVILLQYGHATGTGGYVEGQDFINPAIAPLLQTILGDIKKEVT